MKKEKIITEFWNNFLEKSKLSKETKYIESFHFELNERLANELLRLVLIGQKKATSSSYYAYKDSLDTMPKPGDLSIVTDFDGNPRCVIETKKITIIPFNEITYDLCKLEGEDDDLESWQRGHINFFKNDGAELGYTFTEDMPVVFEEFEMIYKN